MCNHAFAHYGTSFGSVGQNPYVVKPPYTSIFDRMLTAGRTAKLYYFDRDSGTTEGTNRLAGQANIFGSYDQFLADCENDNLPDYSFIEPNHIDHEGAGGGFLLASDQHPDHDVQSGEIYIAAVYNVIRQNPTLWRSTALLVVYDEHGGVYDHVPPPACTPDGFVAPAAQTGTEPFSFDRLGVRVPAILISP